MPVSDLELSFVKSVKYKPKNSVRKVRIPLDVPMMKVEDLVPYPNNVKIHTKQQIAKICASIDKACQWTQPIIVDGNNVIIAGHGRRLAALAYGMAEVPVIALKDISEEDAMVLRLADNKVAEGEIDTNLLEEELRIMAEFDVDMLGIYDERELDFLIEDLGEIDFGSITEDVSLDVGRQSEDNERIAADMDKATYRLSDIFENRPITKEEARALSGLVSYIEDKTQLTGIDALAEFSVYCAEQEEMA